MSRLLVVVVYLSVKNYICNSATVEYITVTIYSQLVAVVFCYSGKIYGAGGPEQILQLWNMMIVRPRLYWTKTIVNIFGT